MLAVELLFRVRWPAGFGQSAPSSFLLLHSWLFDTRYTNLIVYSVRVHAIFSWAVEEIADGSSSALYS